MKRCLLLLVVALAGLLPVGAAESATVRAAEATSPAFAQIAGCISGADNLLVSMVVDESLSLRETDPQAMRVEGMRAAIDSLEQLAELSPDVNVEANLATFARTYSTLIPWRHMDAATAEELRVTAAEQLPGRDAGDATDYRKALLGARQALDSRATALGDPSACKVLLWFTDGALDVDQQTTRAANEICQKGGIADSLRHAGVNVIALALFTPGARVTAQQRDQLRAVAEGQAASTTCGTIPISSDDAAGAYLPADDPAALQLLFAGAGALVAGGTGVGSVACPSAACPDGDLPVAIDPGIAGVRVIAQSSGPVSLLAPTGEEVPLSDGVDTAVGDASVSVLARGSLTTLNISFASYATAPATWQLHLDAPGAVETYYFWGAGLDPLTESVTAGNANDIAFALVARDGSPLPKRLFKSISAEVQVDGTPVLSKVTDDGQVLATYDLSADSIPSSVVVSVSASATSKPSKISLGPISSRVRLPVVLPAAFPTVTPDRVDFGQLSGIGSRRAELTVTGSDLGPSEVCLADASITMPGEKAAPATITTPQECTTVPQSATVTLPLTLTTRQSVDGVGRGEVALALRGADGAETTLVLPASVELARVVDKGKRWELIIALVLAALLIPAALMVGSNLLLLGKFSMSSGSRIANVPVTITPKGLVRAGGGDLVDANDLKNVSFSGRRRAQRMDLDGTGISLRAARIFSLRAPYGVAVADQCLKLYSGFGGRGTDRPDEAPVSLGEVDASFVVIERLAEDEATGRLVVAIPAATDAFEARERARRLSVDNDWSRALQQMREEATISTPAARSTVGAAASTGGDAGDPPPLPGWLDAGRSTGTTSSSSTPTPTSAEPYVPPPLPSFLKDKE